MKKTLILSVLLIASLGAQSQDDNCYARLSPEVFTSLKTDGANQYFGSIQQLISYPHEDRKNHIEGLVRVLILHHDASAIDVIALNDIGGLEEEALKAIKIANERHLKQDSTSYMTELSIKFDLAPWNNKTNKEPSIVVLGAPLSK